MRELFKPVVCLLAGLTAMAISSSVLAGAGAITTVVTRLSDAVTYSRVATGSLPALDTYIGYTVSVGSAPTNTNTVNNIVFTGTITVTDADEVAEYVPPADGAICQVTANPAGEPTNARSISCTIGQLRAGETFPTFAVFFKSPVKSPTVPITPDGVAGQCLTTDCASFRGVTYYAEGTGGINSPPPNSTSCWPGACPTPTTPSPTGVDVTLGTTNPTLVKSGVKTTGGTLFTGSGVAATSADPWTTTVLVPSGFTAPDGATYTSAEISETEGLPPLASDLLTGNVSSLTIPGTFAKLVIKLRRDVSTIAKGAKIATAKVYYSNPTSPNPLVPDYSHFEVPSCADTTFGGPLPQIGIPCISRRTEYTKKNAPTLDWVDDWEFEIFALDNGKYAE